MIIVPLSRLPDDFLPLETRVAGPILQKFATFGTTVAFMGDLSVEMANSNALRAYILETNSRDDIWFLPDKQALAERLAQREG